MKQSDLIYHQNYVYDPIKPESLVVNIKQALSESLTEVLPEHSSIGEILAFRQHKGVRDETRKFLIKDRRGRKIAFALCSSPASSKIVAIGMERSRLATEVLSPELGCHVIQSLCEGKVHGLSYVILPYCQPLSNSRLWWYGQRFFLSPFLFNWLYRLNEETVTEVQSEEIEPNFVVPLNYLAELEMISDRVRAAALETLERLADGTWSPRHVLMHNDLWKGNILLDYSPVSQIKNRSFQERFVITDWAGSMIKGYGMYDLIRLAQSLNLGSKQLRKNVTAHCLILGCDFADARCHLLSALSYLSLNLEYFPLPRFAQVADSCLQTLEEIGG